MLLSAHMMFNKKKKSAVEWYVTGIEYGEICTVIQL